ncbi:VTT domain-containing protein [Candidatus Bathyarchaeota archaeon]|nr:VTT domain-containing protein [Candidatus Bathyarchaeota archaeon]
MAVTIVVIMIVIVAAIAGLLGWEKYLLQYSYVGVFAISIIGAMSIIVPIPYTFIILTLGIEGLNPLLLTVAGGLGSSVGEFSGYLLGYYGRSVISEKQQRKMDYMMRIFDHYGPIAIFLFALTPLPDDLLFIPLGILRYKFIKAFIPCILGKTSMCAILAYGGQMFGNILSMVFGESTPEMNLLISIITAIALVFILVAMLKIDWEKVFEKYVGTERVKKD